MSNIEIIKNFDCLMICLQLSFSWDEKLLKKLIKKHNLSSENPDFDLPFALYQLHHEFHNPDSNITKYLINLFNKKYKKELAIVQEISCDDDTNIFEKVAKLIEESPAGIFWALATDERVLVRSFANYQAHRLFFDAFNAKNGMFFKDVSLKKSLNEYKDELMAQKHENQLLKQRLATIEKANVELSLELESNQIQKRELRKLKYELEKSTLNSSSLATNEDVVDRASLLIEGDAHCPMQGEECLQKLKDGKCSLENLKLALVGGLDRMENQYREIFESKGVKKFYFHSGACAGSGADRLRNATLGVDIVVFITRINSHNAMNILKGECKKSGKYFIALRETNPNQISQIIERKIANKTLN